MNMTLEDVRWLHDLLVEAMKKGQTTISLGVATNHSYPVRSYFGRQGHYVVVDASVHGREEPLHLLTYAAGAVPGHHLRIDKEVLASYLKSWEEGTFIPRLMKILGPYGGKLVEMPPFTINLEEL